MLDINSIMINVNQPVFDNVESNGNVLTAYYKGKPFKIIAGTRTFVYDKKIYYTNSLIFLINGNIYVPIKSFFENLGYTLNIRYDIRAATKDSFRYYSKEFIYYILQGKTEYKYLNGVIYVKFMAFSRASDVIYIKMYDKLSDDFLSELRAAFLKKGIDMRIVSTNTFTMRPTIVFKKAERNLFWIDYLDKTDAEYKYYIKFGYDGELSKKMVDFVGYNTLIICPTTMLNNTIVGFVYLYRQLSDINVDSLVRGVYEYYKSN